MSTRDTLKPLFQNGARPTEQHFADLIDSCVNKSSDGVTIEAEPSNPSLQTLVLSRGLRLGDSSANVPGGLRFNNNQLQVFTGGGWTNVASGGGGAFQPVPTDPTVVAHDGNVVIGAFTAPPTFHLDVTLGNNNGPANQVRFGHVVCANGAGANFGRFAVFAHEQHATSALVNSNYALRQSPDGPVQVNAPSGQPVSLRQGGTNVRLGVSAAGNVIVGGENDLQGAPAGAIFQVAGDVFKSTPGVWGASDARVKEDVRDLELGLSELRQVRPVRFRYNGRAGTEAGRAGVGVLGQEIETIIPETIRRGAPSVPDDPGLEDLRVFDPSALTFVLINAVKELAARVEHLEQALAAVTASAVPAIK